MTEEVKKMLLAMIDEKLEKNYAELERVEAEIQKRKEDGRWLV